MPRPSSSLSPQGFLRILFRWKRAGLAVFLAGLGLSAWAAFGRPLRYEAQVLLERKPPRIAPPPGKQENEEFDVYRLTSESQRSIALIKSPFLMTQWLEAVGQMSADPRERERRLERLRRSLTVQPVPYTDLFVIKVRADSPAEAEGRAGRLAALFSDWDARQNQTEAQQLSRLLQARVDEISHSLASDWARLQTQKSHQSLSLSGSPAARAIETGIAAKGKLFDTLSAELEEAERELDNDRLPRTRVVTPPQASPEPIFSRGLLFGLGAGGALLAALGLILLLEWLDPTVRRTQEIARMLPGRPVFAIPRRLNRGRESEESAPLYTLAQTIGARARGQAPAVVQFTSVSAGRGRCSVAGAVARLLAREHRVCLLHRAAQAGPPPDPRPAAPCAELEANEPVGKQIDAMQTLYDIFLVDSCSWPGDGAAIPWIGEADVTCLLVAAGRTSRHALAALCRSLERFPERQIVFVLERYEDPLPSWLRAS